MAEVFPFRGVLYNSDKIKNLEEVVAPPYDVISCEEQEALYEKSPHNCIRLILGREYPEDDKENNRYVRAANCFKEWQEEEILIRDERPAIYLYEQDYCLEDGRKKTLKGFISLIRLVDYEKGVVLPHETTFSKPTEDRLNLTRACLANFSSIFGLYSDVHDEINQVLNSKRDKPLIDITTNDRITHRLTRIVDEESIERIAAAMKDKQVIIADGHHRYKTALRFRNEMRQKFGLKGPEAFNHTMMFLVNIHDPGLTVLPAHRVIRNMDGLSLACLEKNAQKYFELESFREKEKMFERLKICGRTDHAFGMYAKGSKDYYLMTLRDGAEFERMVEINMSQDWKRLDATVLHILFIDHVLHIGRESVKKQQVEIDYIKDREKALEMVDAGDCQMALFMNPTKILQVERIAHNREKMPQKSTYFYPKLLTGLVKNKIDL
ncbi:DUF1015 domain-containing protein [bacterium]|nr:DUF1015 domain-containing protein [bacterium]MBU1614711.1 DUF1015 domain-containing protein [bacterium]